MSTPISQRPTTATAVGTHAAVTADQAGIPAVELRDVSVRFGQTTALDSFSVRIARGECLALLGPSGSGKSTALNCIAGFLTPSSGQVLLDGKDITGLSPAKRGLGFVVQSYALFPHMSIRENIGFGLKVRGMARKELKERIDEVATLVGMSDHLDKKPSQLSGGQQQRVAIARALAIKPPVLLLDEPTSALDTRLRESMLDELRQLRRDLPDVAMIVVTHDQNEAMALSDHIALLRDGRCEAWSTVSDLFYDPPTAYTATFLGGAGILPGRIVGPADPVTLPVAGWDSMQTSALPPVAGGGTSVLVDTLGRKVLARVPHTVGEISGDVEIAVRPWHWILDEARADSGPKPPAGFRGCIVGDQWRGSVHRCQVLLDGLETPVPVEIADHADRPLLGDEVQLRPVDGAAVVVPREAVPAGVTR